MKKLTSIFLLLSLILCFVPSQALALNANEITCDTAILMEASTGKVLFEREADKKVSIASITKLMVLLITIEEIKAGNLSMDTVIKGTNEAKAIGGSTMFLDVGEEFPLETIIKAMFIASANDGTVALAQHLSGNSNSTDSFVARMNKRAGELGMKNTHFKNVVGFDDFEHYSSAYDVAILCREILTKHSEFLKYAQIKEEWIRDGKTQLLNTNRLLSRYEYATGLKTGTEASAKYCLAATARKDDTDLIAVILGASDNEARVKQAEILLKYGYNSFKLENVAPTDVQLGTVPVKKGKVDEVFAVPSYDVKVVVPEGKKDTVKTEVTLSESIQAPVAKGTEIGSITIRVDGEICATAPLVAQTDVPKISFFGAILKIIRALFSF